MTTSILKAAYVTLLTTESYLVGALVLHHGLRAVNSQYPLVAMVTKTLPDETRSLLKRRGIIVREVEDLQPEEGKHTLALYDTRFADTWTKLRGFELTEYDRIVLLDCDMIIRKNMDDLMDLELDEDEIAAVHVCACNPRKLPHYPQDWRPENCAHTLVTDPFGLPPIPSEDSPRPHFLLNSGTVVLTPSNEVFKKVVHILQTHEGIAEFSFPDQDLLAVIFKGKWKPISWRYNALRTLRSLHPNLWLDQEVRCVHYVLPDKPWNSRTSVESDEEFGVVNSWWWDQFDDLMDEMKDQDKEGWHLVSSSVNQG